eukprot:CAMPEP_0182544694 /NCGR_PEP_ID=MMETSP1323-20130603/33498_1 /TAXON_ID=236787 /ORGANISM="Florenciella parvula, Strain RCC1693" /LENGTH=81 /DNA_ID=CAMNT_0024755771 /DNA_START=214 /DNA_END=463 /DNA_ORIENTATION=-
MAPKGPREQLPELALLHRVSRIAGQVLELEIVDAGRGPVLRVVAAARVADVGVELFLHRPVVQAVVPIMHPLCVPPLVRPD